ncbi:MFS transporter [Bacillus sp. V2I10]|uniref:MFS transporter n=1 Tax=Bacillus sp. V2I10 TaxID=3042276 RepID=UPI0027805AD4|nr:MFS transporter [Bacillus sp. V2I10]MDQ0862007.1 ACS family D-galactonate transporter-like MFS transporter [Bacillus sp. V2I10]
MKQSSVRLKQSIPSVKPTKKRYFILFMVFVSVVINYMDRSNLAIAGPHLASDLGLSSVQMGYIFSAFGWTYAFLQIPGGLLVDKFGPRVMYTISLIGFSLATLLQAFVKGFGGLFGLRLSIGIFEVPAFPANNRIVTSWFPEQQRASAIAFYTSGQFVGIAFLTPVLVGIQSVIGWKGMFIVSGLIGIVWGVIWYFFYRDPSKHKTVNQEELDFIAEGGGLVNLSNEHGKSKTEKIGWKQRKVVFTHRKLWGIYIGQFCAMSMLWFFLTWFPTYLVEYRGLSFIKSGFLTSVPFLAAFVGVLLGGTFSDWLLKRGFSIGVARKTPIITGLLLSTSIIGANFVDSTTLIIVFMTIAFFGNGFASITWSLVSALAPKELLGVTGGTFNFIGNLSSIAIPIVIGYLVRGGNFAPALIFISVVALIGALSYIFIVGKVSRIELQE